MNYLKLNQLTTKLNISKSKLYLNISKGLFPVPVKIGRSSFWPEDEIDGYMCFLVATNRKEMEIKDFVKKIMEDRKNVTL